MWHKITDPSPNFNGVTIEDCEGSRIWDTERRALEFRLRVSNVRFQNWDIRMSNVYFRTNFTLLWFDRIFVTDDEATTPLENSILSCNKNKTIQANKKPTKPMTIFTVNKNATFVTMFFSIHVQVREVWLFINPSTTLLRKKSDNLKKSLCVTCINVWFLSWLYD